MSTILVVEDYPIIAALFKACLAPDGHRVLVAKSLPEVHDLMLCIKSEGVSVAVVDKSLTEGGHDSEGVKVAKFLRTEVPGIHIIGSTADPNVDPPLGWEDSFLPKPFSVTLFRKMVAGALAVRAV